MTLSEPARHVPGPVVVTSFLRAGTHLAKADVSSLVTIACVTGAREPEENRVPGWRTVPRVLTLDFDDVTVDDGLYTPPKKEHVAQLLAFGRDLPQLHGESTAGRLLIHCWKGYSRSTASAFALYAQALGPGQELEALRRTLVACEQDAILPNELMVQHADTLLERGGALINTLRMARWLLGEHGVRIG